MKDSSVRKAIFLFCRRRKSGGRRSSESRKTDAPYRLASGLLAATIMALASGCSDGPLRIQEQYYLAVPDLESSNINYYRITVQGNTALSKAEFRQGWYPADALDALFGEVSEEEAAERLKTQGELQRQLDETLIEIRGEYNKTLREGSPNPEKLQELLNSVAWLRQWPDSPLTSSRYGGGGTGGRKLEDTVTIDYNPAAGMITRRDGQKLVFVLAADPDQIIQDIQKIAEDQKTQVLIKQFADLAVRTANKDVTVRQAQAQFAKGSDDKIAKQIDAALERISDADVDKDVVLAELEALIGVVSQVQAGEE